MQPELKMASREQAASHSYSTKAFASFDDPSTVLAARFKARGASIAWVPSVRLGGPYQAASRADERWLSSFFR